MSKKLIAALIGTAFLALCGLGVTVTTLSSLNKAQDQVNNFASPSAPPITQPTTKPTEAAKSKPSPVPATIQEGVWAVGEDIPAGTYKVKQAVKASDMCYWMKSSDSDGQKIIANGLPTGGRPQVTLKKGEFFTTQSCGEWQKK